MKRENWFKKDPKKWFQEMEEALARLKKHIEDNREKLEKELEESKE